MRANRKTTVVGGFTVVGMDTDLGHIIIETDGAPIRRTIGLIDEVLDADNRVEGCYRPGGGQQFIITVVADHRNEETMILIFSEFITSFRKVLKVKPELVKSMTAAAATPDMASTIDVLMSQQ